jgi:hypothetical protein
MLEIECRRGKWVVFRKFDAKFERVSVIWTLDRWQAHYPIVLVIVVAHPDIRVISGSVVQICCQSSSLHFSFFYKKQEIEG